MSFSSWTLNLLLLATAPGQGEAPPHAINRRDFKIPIVIGSDQRALMKELSLYVSADQGKTWSQTATATPDKDHFRFFAQADGLYWFTVVVVDQQGKSQPADVYSVPPSQKILVDSIKPAVQIVLVDRDGDEVLVNWDIRDDNLDLSSMRLEYRPFDAPTQVLWQTVSVTAAASGQARFRPTYTGPLVVRINVRDRAGNSGMQEKDVPPATTTANATPLPSQPNPPVNNAPINHGGNAAFNPGTGASPLSNGQFPPNRSSYQPPPYPPQQQVTNPPPPSGFPPGNHQVYQQQPVYPPQYQQQPVYPPQYQQQPVYPPSSFVPGGQEQQDDPRVVAASGGSMPPSNPAAPTGSMMAPPRVVNSPQVALEYEVKCGTSGVTKVELWLSQDDGRSWRYFTDDPTVGSPLEATLPGEGIFGLKLVVHSGAGLSKGPPLAGDAPDLRLEVDTTPPLVHMYEPKPDPRRRDTLTISWNATDRNLAPRPVTLEWADRPEGPWRLIATDLPSTGAHAWQLSTEIPVRVLLRATAIDTATNRGIAQTESHILTDLSKPEGRILGIAPINRPMVRP